MLCEVNLVKKWVEREHLYTPIQINPKTVMVQNMCQKEHSSWSKCKLYTKMEIM